MIRGWCPGALRPMPSGDGLIVRLRLRYGIVDADSAIRIAQWSRDWGNGQIDLSSRSNLQLRGLSAQDVPKLQKAMAEAGVLDPDPDAEAVRNVIASPMAGLDPTALLDIRPVCASLEHRLVTDASLHGLPGKFGFAVDDGGAFSLEGVSADIRFVAAPGATFRINLAGAPDAFGPCGAGSVPDVAARIAHAFLRHGGARRMRDVAAATIADAAGLLPILPSRAAAPGTGELQWQPLANGGKDSLVGAHAVGNLAFLGVGLPFGRITADELADLAAEAGELRLTPWRTLLIPAASLAVAHGLQMRLAGHGFVFDPRDPRRRVAACPGAPACPQATTLTRNDALALAERLPPGRSLHVSGCEKGCAHATAAATTLVGRDGLYDLIRNGSASAAPTIRGLTLAEAAEHLA